MHAAARLGGLDDRRHVVGVAIDGDTSLEDIERNAFGLQVAIIDADERGKLRSGGMAHDEDSLRIAAILGDVLVDPAQRLRHIANDRLHVHLRQQAIVGRDKHESPVHERLRLFLHAGFVARLPAAAVNPEDDGVFFAFGWSVDIERLPLVLGLGVGQVTLDFRLDGQSRGAEDQKHSNRFHDGQSP